MKVISFSGFSGSGKDTLAAHIKSLYPTTMTIAFADILKQMAAERNKLNIDYFYNITLKDTPLVSHGNQTPRDMCLSLAKSLRETDPLVFVKPVIKSVKSHENDYTHYIITDTRLPNELTTLKESFEDFTSVYIKRHDVSPIDHPTEYSITKSDCDLFVPNVTNNIHDAFTYIKHLFE